MLELIRGREECRATRAGLELLGGREVMTAIVSPLATAPPTLIGSSETVPAL